MPKRSPPYHASIFPVKAKQVISIFSCILGYYSDQWVDEFFLLHFSLYFPMVKSHQLFYVTVSSWQRWLMRNSWNSQMMKFLDMHLFWCICLFILNHTCSLSIYRRHTITRNLSQPFTGPPWLGRTTLNLNSVILYINLYTWQPVY